MLPQQLNLEAYQGDSFYRTIQFVNSSAVAINISSWDSITAEIKGSLGLAFTVTILDAVTGVISLSLTAADMETLSENAYAWDCERELTGDSEPIKTIIAGKLRVWSDVTRVVV